MGVERASASRIGRGSNGPLRHYRELRASQIARNSGGVAAEAIIALALIN